MFKKRRRIKMKRLIVLTLLLLFVMPVTASKIFAVEETTQTGIMDAGNKLCPVSGDPVSGNDFVIYKGKRYGLCCPMCKASFLKEPEKYIAQMEAKEKTSAPPAAVAPVVSESEEMERDMEQGDL